MIAGAGLGPARSAVGADVAAALASLEPAAFDPRLGADVVETR